MKKLKLKGFTTFEVLMVLLIFALIGTIGLYVWYRHDQSSQVTPPKKLPNITVQKCATEPELTLDCNQIIHPPSGWLSYQSTHSTIGFIYPENWTVKMSDVNNEPGINGPKPNYFLEDVNFTGQNGFALNFVLEKTHNPPVQNWLCATYTVKSTDVPLNTQYQLVFNGIGGLSLESTNSDNLKPDDYGCGAVINAIGDNLLFKFTGSYNDINTKSGVTQQNFLNQPEVQTAKTIFASLLQ